MFTSRQILGNGSLDKVRSFLMEKEGWRPEQIHEISVHGPSLEQEVEKYFRPEGDLKNFEAKRLILNISRDDGAQMITIGRYGSGVSGKLRVDLGSPILVVNYQIFPGDETDKVRFRFTYIRVLPEFRKQLAGDALDGITNFLRTTFPGSPMEVRMDRLIMGFHATHRLEKMRFIEIEPSRHYMLARPLDPEFLRLLENVGVLEAEDLQQLLETVAGSAYPDKQAQALELHNQFIRRARQNFLKDCQNAQDEVHFVFQKLHHHPLARELVTKGAYRGDLWAEGLPKPLGK